MMDLHHRLEEIAGPPVPPTIAQLENDLARGRRALRRRRRAQTVVGSALAIAALVAGFTLVGTGAGTNRDGYGVTDFPAAAGGAGTTIVDYTGEQPKAYTIGKIPAGWFIQSSGPYSVVLAPDKAKNPGPNVNPSKEPLYDSQDYSGKIMIGLESRDQNGPEGGKRVQVGDAKGALVPSLGWDIPGRPSTPPARSGLDGGATLWIQQESDPWIIVQVWEGLGFTEQQIIEIGTGVRVKNGAKQAGG
jgi:hypothetical protein